MSQPVVFRPRGGVVLAVIAIVVCAVALVFLAVYDGIPALVRWGWPIVLIAWGSWLLYVRPAVTVTDGFVEIRNIVRTHRVPWGDVADVDSRYALTIVTASGRRIRAWAAPAPGARAALTTRREEVNRTPGDGDTRRPSDSENSHSGGAAALVRRHLDAYRREGGAGLAGATTTTWDAAPIGVTVALAAAAVLSVAWPHA
jgi:hypothetical protein